MVFSLRIIINESTLMKTPSNFSFLHYVANQVTIYGFIYLWLSLWYKDVIVIQVSPDMHDRPNFTYDQ